METCCHSNSSASLSVNADVKNSKGVDNNKRQINTQMFPENIKKNLWNIKVTIV